MGRDTRLSASGKWPNIKDDTAAQHNAPLNPLLIYYCIYLRFITPVVYKLEPFVYLQNLYSYKFELLIAVKLPFRG